MPIYSEWTKYPFGLRMLPVGPHGKACIIRQLLPVPPHATSFPGIGRRTPRYPHARVSNRHNRSGTSTSATGKQPPQPTRITKATRPPSQSQHTRPHHRSNQSQSQFRQTHTTTQRSINHSSWGPYPEHRNLSRAHTKRHYTSIPRTQTTHTTRSYNIHTAALYHRTQYQNAPL